MNLNLQKLYTKVDNHGISIFEYSIPVGMTKATSISISKQGKGKCGIFYDPQQIANEQEQFSVLAHEYGHCVSGALHKVNTPLDIVARHEYRADRKSILTFLPYHQLQKALKSGYTQLYQLSEYFDLPEDFIKLAISHYKDMGLIK